MQAFSISEVTALAVTMGHTLPHVLFLCSLTILLCCGHAEDVELTVEPSSLQFYSGESLTFTCSIRNGNGRDWQFNFIRNNRQMTSFSPNNFLSLTLTASSGGDYWCSGRRGNSTRFMKQSDKVTLSVSAHRPSATLTVASTSIPVSGVLRLVCSVENSTGWRFDWFHRVPDSYESIIVAASVDDAVNISHEGIYRCRGRRGILTYITRKSAMSHIERKLSNSISVSLKHNVTRVYSGEMVTIRCEIQDGGNSEWEYEWRTDSGSYTPSSSSEYTLISASVSSTGNYWCMGRKNLYSSTEWSGAFTLTVLPYRPRPTLTADQRTIQVKGGVTLTCAMENSTEWQYHWFRQSHSSAAQIVSFRSEGTITVYEGGLYYCKGQRRRTAFVTDASDRLMIEEQVTDKTRVTLEPNWPLIFTGEDITIKCVVYGGRKKEWTYEWSKSSPNCVVTKDEYRIVNATESNSGSYRCRARNRGGVFSSTEWSDFVTLTVSERASASLNADTTAFTVGGSVSLTCSVNQFSSGWDYYWYRGDTNSEPLVTRQNVPNTRQSVNVSYEGLYWCRGGRGDPVYYTEYSNPVAIHQKVVSEVAVTLQPNWPLIYVGESVTLRCEIQGNDTEWEYEWITTSSRKPPNTNQFRIDWATSTHCGFYWCKGRWKSARQNSTRWSLSRYVAVSFLAQNPVLTLSSSWSSPGAPVTLTCKVEHLSAGWRFYWYKASPEQLYYHHGFQEDSWYSFEQLPGSSSGTEQNSYTVYGQTHPMGYLCQAGRGDPVYYTEYSAPKIVWFGDFQSSVSLTVSPSRVQHFTYGRYSSASVTCKGTFPGGRVWMFNGEKISFDYVDCSSHSMVNGHVCSMNIVSTGVYWCENGFGETSSAVNITAVQRNVLLVSPVHAVTEGDSVTLSCELMMDVFPTVTFYKDGKLIQHDYSSELKISRVSKSDEGFYKCRDSGHESFESWMSVKVPARHSFPVPLVTGLVCGVALVLLLSLLLLCCYRKAKRESGPPTDPCGDSQKPATEQTVHEGENQEQVYSSLLHGDICVYESVAGSGHTRTECRDGKGEEPESNCAN